MTHPGQFWVNFTLDYGHKILPKVSNFKIFHIVLNKFLIYFVIKTEWMTTKKFNGDKTKLFFWTKKYFFWNKKMIRNGMKCHYNFKINTFKKSRQIWRMTLPLGKQKMKLFAWQNLGSCFEAFCSLPGWKFRDLFRISWCAL